MSSENYKPSIYLGIIFLLLFPIISIFILYPTVASTPLTSKAICLFWLFWIFAYLVAIQMVKNLTIKSKSNNKQSVCSKHGEQGTGLVCTHIAHAVDKKELVGFYWGDDKDLAKPDAWCKECENKLVALDGASSEQWFLDCENKIFCACCWDEAKEVCGGMK